MTRLLVKKQLREIFRQYFFVAKRNKARSKKGIIAYFIFFIVIMAGVLGGVFTMLSNTLCGPLVSAGIGWLYYIIMGVIAILLGVFGSVFNTYSALYLAKDNDLLLSLPIPVNAIMVSRLLTVYLMGLMYSACVLIPAIIVYWIQSGFSLMKLFGALLLLLYVSVIDLVLSCIMGYFIARISLKLKNKGILTALIAVVFIGVYYFFSFRFNTILNYLIENADQYGEKIKGSAWLLYAFGTIGEGGGTGMLIWAAICAAALLLTWFVLQKSFIKIATATGSFKKAVYREKTVRQKSADSALLMRELKRFTGSATYMLNCGLGIILLPVAGILLLWQGDRLMNALSEMATPDIILVCLSAVLCMASSMIDTAAPSVSLEGKSIWLVQSLPVGSWNVLKAKMRLQILLSIFPMLFALICGAVVIARQPDITPVKLVFFILIPIMFQVLMACWGLFWGVRMARTNWTSEIYPLKQSMPIVLSMFGGWAMAVAFGGLYLLLMSRINPVLYLVIAFVIILAGTAVLILWFRSRGAKRFAELK